MTILNALTIARMVQSQVEQLSPTVDTALVLPSAANMVGKVWTIANGGTANILVQSSGANLVVTVQPSTSAMLTPLIDSPTTAAHWMVTTNGLNASGLRGNASGNPIATGYLGEVVESKISTITGSAAISTAALALTSITLTPGVWDLTAVASIYAFTSLTSSNIEFCIGGTTASFTGTTFGYDYVQMPLASLSIGLNAAAVIPRKIVTISANTTYYLNVTITYSAGDARWRGALSAVRIA